MKQFIVALTLSLISICSPVHAEQRNGNNNDLSEAVALLQGLVQEQTRVAFDSSVSTLVFENRQQQLVSDLQKLTNMSGQTYVQEIGTLAEALSDAQELHNLRMAAPGTPNTEALQAFFSSRTARKLELLK